MNQKNHTSGCDFFKAFLLLILEDQLVVLNRWEWIVEVVQKCLPFLIFFGAAKTDRMRLQGFPLNKQDVPVPGLQAVLQLMRHIARHARNNRGRGPKCGLELNFLTGDHIQDRYFQDH